MIERVLAASLAHRWIVLLLASGLVVFGALRAKDMPVDVFPDLTAPRVTIVTESTGLAAEEIEKLITFPVETAINGTAGLRTVRSASAPGISLVWAEFDWSTSSNVARQRITERLQAVTGTFPEGTSPPVFAPAASVMGEIAFLALTDDGADPAALRRFAEVTVRRRLLATPGISQVVCIGGDEKQYQVLVDPYQLERRHLTLREITEAIERGSDNAPGGYLVDRGQESVIRITGRARSMADLESIVVAVRDEAPVRVRDIATVVAGATPRRGTASYNGTPAVVLSVVKQPDADTASTTTRMDNTLDQMAPEFARAGVQLHRDVFRQKDFIDRAIENVARVLRDGALLVIVVLFLFLWSVRPTLISLTAIPLSLVTATLTLEALGFTVDTMTLGGLAIAVGELVDDAIVDVENVARRLRERAQRVAAGGSGEAPSVYQTVLAASLEIRASIVSATYVILLVFAPLLFLDGVEGRLLRPLAVAYLVAVFASLVVAITVTPVLCSIFLPGAVTHHEAKEPPLLDWIGARYQPVLAWAMHHTRAVAYGAGVVVLVGLAALLPVGRAFLPEFNEGSFNIGMVLTPGTSLGESDALATMAERALQADPAVASVARRTGRAERDEHVQGVEASEFEVRMRTSDPRTKERLLTDLRERLSVVPGAGFTFGQPISHRIEHMLSGQRAGISVKVAGEDLSALRRTAARIKEVAEQVPQLVDVNVEQVAEIPQWLVPVDATRAANYGFSRGEAAHAIGTALWGAPVGHIYEEGTSTEVVVKYGAEWVGSGDALARVPIPTPMGPLVPLAALADPTRDTGPNYILREKVERRVVVTANIRGGDALTAVRALREAVDRDVRVPSGVHVAYAGEFERAESAGRSLLLLGLLAVFGVGAIVVLTLGTLRRALIALANIPFALAGGVVGVYLSGGVLSVATLIGFITLFGIAMRNGILLLTRVRDLEEGGAPLLEATRRAAAERLAPILMTATTAALGLLPLGLSLGRPGSEIQAPMALVILTGLITSTALNSLVVPALLVRWGAAAERAKG